MPIAREKLSAFIAAAFEKVGMRPRDAAVVGDLMAEADLQGSDGHGSIRLPQYVKRIRAGGVNLAPTFAWRRSAPAWRSSTATTAWVTS